LLGVDDSWTFSHTFSLDTKACCETFYNLNSHSISLTHTQLPQNRSRTRHYTTIIAFNFLFLMHILSAPTHEITGFYSFSAVIGLEKIYTFDYFLYLLSSHHWYRGNSYFIGQFSHVIPAHPPTSIFKSSKQIEVRLQSVVLQWMHTKHIFAKQLHILWNGIRELSGQLLHGAKGRMTGFSSCCARIYLQTQRLHEGKHQNIYTHIHFMIWVRNVKDIWTYKLYFCKQLRASYLLSWLVH